MNLTLALDDELLMRAREVARQQGTSLNDMIRAYLESVTGRRSAEAVVGELQELWEAEPGHSGGRTIRREDAYEGRL